MPIPIPTIQDRSQRIFQYHESAAVRADQDLQRKYVQWERFFLLAASITAVVLYFRRK